ncbi:MAG TPA: Wadjet anti-phage system protein JetD domain-containing protein [Rhodocyclaceae bacterium]|jgi:hypothetical protein
MLEASIYECLCKKVRGNGTNRIRTKTALSKLSTHISHDSIEIRKALLALRADGKVEYSTGSHGEPISAFITVIPPKVVIPAYVTGWKAVLEQSGLPNDDLLALESIGCSLDGFCKGDMERLLAGMVRLRKEQTQVYGQCDFNVSAAYLLGSSKLLSALDSRSLRAFGIAIDQFPARAPYVVVGGNTDSPVAVILVENPIPFETAVRSAAAERCLFICTFGFGLSTATNDYGNQLAGIIENGRAVVLNRSHGAAPTLQAILAHPVVQFWGDLDTAGMQIFQRLVAAIPQIKLSGLYKPLIEAAKDPLRRHPYTAVTGKEGQPRMVFQTNDTYVIRLLTACKDFGVDQEIVTHAEISAWAGEILDAA